MIFLLVLDQFKEIPHFVRDDRFLGSFGDKEGKKVKAEV